MRKFIFYFFIYIVLSFAVFNNAAAKELSVPLPFEEMYQKKIQNGQQTLDIKADNEFFKLYAVFLLADKVFEGSKVNDTEALTRFLHLAWPETDIEKLQYITPYFQFFIMSKRRYNYVVESLKQKIKAANILPSDAPIVAKDGEFAPKYSDERKTTSKDQYKISYTPYRYLEYDNQELGEPVRRRDKNYQEVKESLLDEITLSILQFDIKKFIESLKKLPPENDGSREVSVELENGLASRIVLDTALPGQKETIRGVIEIAVPKGFYINGDYLNPKAKPKFYLSEDNKEDLNIKEYELFYPEAVGVENNGITSRILVEDVKFPITFKRRDINKDLNIKGQFVFQVCKAKTKECHNVISSNSLFIERSIDEDDSIHYNFVNTEFGRLPQRQTPHAKLIKAVYNPATKMLNLKFKTTKKFSNAAAMAEDAAETNFLDAKYQIKPDEIDISFKTDIIANTDNENENIKNIEQGGEIAVTAAFDEFEVMREVVRPEIISIPDLTHFKTVPNYSLAFLYGLLLPLMPGIAYLLQRLLQVIYENKNRKKIFLRYALSTFICIGICGSYFNKHPWWQIYENKYLNLIILMLVTSYLMAAWNYMDFNLFRPFKGVIRRGYFIGFLTILAGIALPTLYKKEVWDNLTDLGLKESLYTGISVWIGMICLPFMGLIFYRHIREIPAKMQYINRAYTLIAIILLLWIGYNLYGMPMLVIEILTSLLTAFVWYIYPMAISETVSHTRSEKQKYALFVKVEHHGAIIITVIGIISSLASAFISLKTIPVPTVSDIIKKAQTEISSDKSLLFSLTRNWSLQSVFHNRILQNINQDKITPVTYPPQGNNQNTSEWLKTYNKKSPPLNILYTKRHPKGFVLPDNLDGINWDEAIRDFIENVKTTKGDKQP